MFDGGSWAEAVIAGLLTCIAILVHMAIRQLEAIQKESMRQHAQAMEAAEKTHVYLRFLEIHAGAANPSLSDDERLDMTLHMRDLLDCVGLDDEQAKEILEEGADLRRELSDRKGRG